MEQERGAHLCLEKAYIELQQQKGLLESEIRQSQKVHGEMAKEIEKASENNDFFELFLAFGKLEREPLSGS